jgi:excinuclease ABC subunit A
MPRACRSPRSPETLAKAPRSYTGKYLAPLLERGRVGESVAAE